MKTVINKTSRPLRLTLPRGGMLHLGPHREGHIQDHAVEWPGIRRHLLAGEIEIEDTESGRPHAAGGEAGNPETHGHQKKAIRIAGDR